jgi:hypothetical protein
VTERLTITEGPADPESIRRMACYRRNREWLGGRGASFFEPFRGRYVAAAEGEVFVADDALEAQRLARAKYPEEEPFIIHIPREKLLRIYAC